MNVFRDAALVLDGFGAPGRPAGVRRDPDGLVEHGVLDMAALEKIVTRPL